MCSVFIVERDVDWVRVRDIAAKGWIHIFTKTFQVLMTRYSSWFLHRENNAILNDIRVDSIDIDFHHIEYSSNI